MFKMDQFADLFNINPETMNENVGAMAKMWMDLTSKMLMTGMTLSQGLTPPEAGREMRNTSFKALSDFFGDYMRSPQYLEMTRQSMDLLLSFRKQMDQYLTQAHHEMQGVAREDIASLHKSLRHIEDRLLDRLDEMQESIDDLADRLEQMETLVDDEERRSRRHSTAQKPEAAAAAKTRKSAKTRTRRQG